jgi:hypothetical protein
VTLHLLKTIASILALTSKQEACVVLMRHAERIARSGQEGLAHEADQQAVKRCYEEML